MEKKSPEQQVIDGDMVTGNFTLQAQLPMGKTMTVSGYIYSKNTMGAVNKQIDFLHDVMDRQRLRAEIPELEVKRDQRIVQLGQIRDHLGLLSKKQDNGGKLSSAEKKMIEELTINVKRVMEDIDKGELAIAEAKLKIKQE